MWWQKRMTIRHHVSVWTHREEKKRNVRISRAIFLGVIPRCPFVADSHLANTQDGTTCQGLPWAPDRALCGRGWILWRISGIYGDKQTAAVYFHVCCRKLNLVVLLLISALPAWILTRTGTVGRWQKSNSGRAFQVQVCRDYIQHLSGCKNKKILFLPDDLYNRILMRDELLDFFIVAYALSNELDLCLWSIRFCH